MLETSQHLPAKNINLILHLCDVNFSIPVNGFIFDVHADRS